MTRPNMTPVYTGVSTVLWGLILTFLGFFLLIVTAAMAFDTLGSALKDGNAAGVEGKADATGLLARIAIYTLVAGSILNILGLILCLGAPESMEGKGLIYVAVACTLVSAGITVADIFTTVSSNVTLAGGLLSLISSVTFIAFLGKVGVFIGNSTVSKGASSTLRVGAYLLGCYAVIVVAAIGGMAAVSLIFGLVALVLGIMLLVKYITLLVNTKAALKFAPADDADL